MAQALQQARAVRVVPRSAPAVGWFCHVVRPLMSPPGQVRAAQLDAAAVARGQGAGAGLCFAGGEGGGCPLSLAEQRIADRVASEPMSWEAR